LPTIALIIECLVDIGGCFGGMPGCLRLQLIVNDKQAFYLNDVLSELPVS
jgi:hypothetical protein